MDRFFFRALLSIFLLAQLYQPRLISSQFMCRDFDVQHSAECDDNLNESCQARARSYASKDQYRNMKDSTEAGIYTNDLKNRFLTASAVPHIFCSRSRLASRQWSLGPNKKSEAPPCQIPDSSSCSCINVQAKENSPPKKAIIFGITGQDGSYLTEFLLNKNYEVHGVVRRSSLRNTERIDQFYQEDSGSNQKLFLHYGDLCDDANVCQLITTIQPDEIYNLAAQSHVKVSFEMPLYTAEVDALGCLRILEGIRQLAPIKKVKFYQASTSELFGLAQEMPQTEQTPFHPRSPYGVSKLFAHWIAVNYREAYGVFACNGILFNHESPLREETFVTRKITLAACRYKLGLQETLYIGNLDSVRDWGYAKDYVEAMWLMLQQEKPDDYVVSTGRPHSVREFVELTFKELGIEIEWQGKGVEEVGIDKKSGKAIVKVDPKYYRPSEVDFLLGNAEKAAQVLNWKPKTDFHELLKIMVAADLQKASMEASASAL